jgi:hypothetical protein
MRFSFKRGKATRLGQLKLWGRSLSHRLWWICWPMVLGQPTIYQEETRMTISKRRFYPQLE